MAAGPMDGHVYSKGWIMVEARKLGVGVGVAAIALACSLAVLAPQASALPYAHSDKQADAGLGLVHIAVTLDCSEVGGPVKAVWLPVNSSEATVEAVMNEFLTASESKVDRFAHEDYAMESLADFLADKNYTVTVHKAGAQKPGADAVYTSDSVGDEAYEGLVTGDGVYITVTE